MNVFKVYVNWEVTGHVLVVADSVDEAEGKVSAVLSASDRKVDRVMVDRVLESEVVAGTVSVLVGVTDEVRGGVIL